MIPILGFNGRLELENFDKNGVPNPHEAASYHGHQAHHAASACAAAAVAVAGLAPNLVDSSDLSNELWLHASANGPNGPDFEAAVNAAAVAGYAKEHHPHQGSAASAASAVASNFYHPYEAGIFKNYLVVFSGLYRKLPVLSSPGFHFSGYIVYYRLEHLNKIS